MICAAMTKTSAAAIEGRTAPTAGAARGIRLRELDRALAHDPDCFAARFERAGLLREQGSFEEAKRDYIELIRRRPTDFGTLNDFGTLVLNAGYRQAARSLFNEAVRHHPDNANGRVNLANLLLLIGERSEARVHFEAALAVDPGHVHAHRGMGNLLAEIGDEAGARRHRDRGFKDHFLTTLPYRGEGSPIAVLLLVSALGGNIPTSSILDDRHFRTSVLVTEYCDDAATLPPHDVVFNGIGDADLCGEGLDAAGKVLARTSRPVINHPAQVRRTGRLAIAERLRGLPNVVTPRMTSLPRRLLTGRGAAAAVAGNRFCFPVLARAPGTAAKYILNQGSTLRNISVPVHAAPTGQYMGNKHSGKEDADCNMNVTDPSAEYIRSCVIEPKRGYDQHEV